MQNDAIDGTTTMTKAARRMTMRTMATSVQTTSNVIRTSTRGEMMKTMSSMTRETMKPMSSMSNPMTFLVTGEMIMC
jgi:hypothetical protein